MIVGLIEDILGSLVKDVAIPTAVSILSAYLYHKLKSRTDSKLKIDGIDVRIDKGKIERILIKRLEKSES